MDVKEIYDSIRDNKCYQLIDKNADPAVVSPIARECLKEDGIASNAKIFCHTLVYVCRRILTKPFFLAVRHGDTEIVTDYILSGGDVSIFDDEILGKDAKHWTALHWACWTENWGIVDMLLDLADASKSLTIRGGNGRLPIHLALMAIECNDRICKKMLNLAHETVNAEDESGWTPLCIAARNGKYHIAMHLISLGANVNHKKKDGWTPYHLAMVNGHENTARLLVDSGAEQSVPPEQTMPPGKDE